MERKLILSLIGIVCIFVVSSCAAPPLMTQNKKDDGALLSRALNVAQEIEVPHAKAAALQDIALAHSSAEQYAQAAKVADTIEDPHLKAFTFFYIAVDARKNMRQEIAQEMIDASKASIESIDRKYIQAYMYILMGEHLESIYNKEGALKALSLAYEVAKPIEDERIKAYIIALIGQKYFDFGDKVKAGESISEAYEIAQSLDDDGARITIIDMIAFTLAADGQVDRAFEIIEEVRVSYTKAAGPDLITDLYLADNNYEKAVLTANKIENPYTRIFTLVRISFHAWDHGKKDAALLILSRASEIAKSIEEKYIETLALNWSAKGFAKTGQFDKAVKIAQSIENEYNKDEALEQIAIRYAITGDFGRALKVIDSIEVVFYKTMASIEVTEVYLKSADKERAEGLINQAFEISKDIPDDLQRFKTLALIAPIYEELGQQEMALKIARSIEDYHLRNTAFFRMTSWHTQKREFSEAIELALIIEDPYYKASAFTQIAAR